ncbi:protein cueball isoform X2 [Epargyreus clarus]|uniref:protein cueball isoform X2 n=1 Tax=Epargyreus clarus TaxID=520877 RepID=UPI003C308712
MCKTQCFLAFVALSINLVSSFSWDIAVTNGDQLEFYANYTITHVERGRFRALTALAYDAVHNMLLFVDKQNDNTSIFSFHFDAEEDKQYRTLIGWRSDVQDLAFDPVSGKLFWTDMSENSIFWVSSKQNTTNNEIDVNLLIKMTDEIPRAIVVDSCRGYIYWTNINISKPTIEMARFDGSDRRVIVNTNIDRPISLALDQRTKRLYWADDKLGIYYTIESSDLEGKDRKTLLHGSYHEPNVLTVSNDSIYWVEGGHKSVWKIPKNAVNPKPEEVASFRDPPFGIVANYKVEDQTMARPECEALTNVLKNKSSINDFFNIPGDTYCLHGDKIKQNSTCKCFRGYTGIRCQTNVCENFCFNGRCNLTPEGNPQCLCKPGFSGARCQTNVCYSYCLNNGKCSLDCLKPVCKCVHKFEGERCETRVVEATVPPTTDVPCNCSDTRTNSVLFRMENLTAGDGVYVDTASCSAGWDPVRDPILMFLGALCGLLCLACAVLITKILQLKKRPRIKKRIIVNKNVTPLTARPDQCEITIENCCNMNICETVNRIEQALNEG